MVRTYTQMRMFSGTSWGTFNRLFEWQHSTGACSTYSYNDMFKCASLRTCSNALPLGHVQMRFTQDKCSGKCTNTCFTYANDSRPHGSTQRAHYKHAYSLNCPWGNSPKGPVVTFLFKWTFLDYDPGSQGRAFATTCEVRETILCPLRAPPLPGTLWPLGGLPVPNAIDLSVPFGLPSLSAR